MADDVSLDPTTDPSVAEDIKAVPEVSAPPEAPEAVPPEGKDTDGDLAEDKKPKDKKPKDKKPKADKTVLEANADGADLTASVVPKAPDLTPKEEAAIQVADPHARVDASGILQQTNQEVLDQLPKNENGQVVLDENGQVVGLAPADQPSPQPGSEA